MSAEGFGCLFLPSIVPNNFPAAADFSSATLLATGIGMGDRGFPGNFLCAFLSCLRLDWSVKCITFESIQSANLK